MLSKDRQQTYGGEVEILAVDHKTHLPRAVPPTFLKQTEARLTSRDMHGRVPNLGFDACTHLLEVGVGVYPSLEADVAAAVESVTALHDSLAKIDTALVSTAYHPTGDPKQFYQNVNRKAIYELLRGPYGKERLLHPDVLPNVYSENPEGGRGWYHMAGTLAASVQPWNSLDPELAIDQLRVLQSTGFMFNLLLANSPYSQKGRSDVRDVRLKMWGEGGMLASSRYSSDRLLTENIASRPKGITDYLSYVLGNQRAVLIPHGSKDSHGGNYKTSFMAVVQPPDESRWNMLDFLEAKGIDTVDIETGDRVSVRPSVAHIVNGFDFQYFPRYGARFRFGLPRADEVDPQQFAFAIRNRNEQKLQDLLSQGGINDGGYICAEGRVSATVLPTVDHSNWRRLAIPFVLQTALIRNHVAVQKTLDRAGLSWTEVTREFPKLTNSRWFGFHASLRGNNATQLASSIWEVARESLSDGEKALVGDEVDSILASKIGPAEEQISFVENEYKRTGSMDEAFGSLLNSLLVVVPPSKV